MLIVCKIFTVEIVEPTNTSTSYYINFFDRNLSDFVGDLKHKEQNVYLPKGKQKFTKMTRKRCS